MSQRFLSKAFACLVLFSGVALQAQTRHSISSIFSGKLARGIALADTLTLAPSIRATQPVLQAFLGGQRLSSGTWIEIYGTNLASATADWGGLFNGNQAPTAIGQTSVTIDGKQAFMFFVTPGANGNPSQINALVPDGVGLGPVKLEVTTPNGTASTIVTVSQITPAMLTTPSFNVGGKQYAAALFANELNQGQQIFVGKANLIPGANFRPAKPGDILTIFAVGCGPTTPPTTAGTIVNTLNQIANPVQVKFGETVATTQAFMSPGSIGLCQLNVTVPNVADGDLALTTTIGGNADGQGLFVTVQH